MKKIFTLLLVFCTFFSQAQTALLAGGGYAPDFTATDINGTSHNLYDYLDSGYVVVVELLSVSCGHCMQHAAGTENSYQTNGPNGTNTARFIGLETNASTNDAAIQNFASLYTTSFPICNNISPTAINYQLYYTPGYYVIYPDSSYTTICPSYCQQTGTSTTIESLLNTAIAAWPFVSGCTDPTAVNYNATANTDDGSCDYTSYAITTVGMTFSPDTILCDVGDTINFSVGGYHNAVEVDIATWQAGGSTPLAGGFSVGFGATGQFVPTNAQTHYYVCQPHASMGMKGVIIASTPPVYGCTDSTAFNYNAASNTDDGSCTYCVWGCMDPSADNFNPLANCCDSICYYNGCTDPTALNYDSTANVDDGSCSYTCTDNEVILNMYDSWGDGWNGGGYIITDISGDTVATGGLLSGSFGADTLCLLDGCYDIYVGSFGSFGDSEISFDFGSLQGSMAGSFTNICFGTVNGCTDPTALNYDSTANVDDGTCIYSACQYFSPTNIHTSNIIHDRATINWDNMNTNNCMVDQYRIKYRAQGTTAWSSKTMGAPVGSCAFGTNKTDKLLLNLSLSTTYEYQMKAWYCGGGASAWTSIQTFSTLSECPNITNLQVSTPTTTKATFTWDTTASYSFVRIKARVDVTGSTWFNVGGFGVLYPTLTKNKNGLVAGTSYRAQARTWCNPNGGAYRSAVWTSPITWTQPASARITNKEVTERKLLRVTDLLGKEVNPKKVIDKTTLLYIYDDGTVEKKIIVE